MKIETDYKSDGSVYAIDVKSIGVRTLLKVLKRYERISSLVRLKYFFNSDEPIISFVFNNVDIIIWIPFGDSGIYRIQSRNDEVDLVELKNYLQEYKLNFLEKLFML
ncbi:MAG: hypothetical protein KJO88_01905 [Gammaproteobacteria bacterium]|nr:hypothetical protein [Gammaproteobacteria bacterium]